MEQDKFKGAVAFMSRHFVALACEYESLTPDGSVFARGTTVFSGFLLEIYSRVFWVTAGHCLKGELDKNIDEGKLRIIGGGFLDFFGHQAVHHHRVPFTYEAHSALYVEEPENGLDFALLMLDGLQEQLFAANNLIPITRENWIHQHRLTFDFYLMLGIPTQSVFPGKSFDDISLQQMMIPVDRLSHDEVTNRPFGVVVPSEDWFIGRLDRAAEINDIKGMSGGPIFGFRKNADGKLLYHAVAVQSRWWDKSRTVFGCSIPYFAEAIHRQIDEFAKAYQWHEHG